MAVHPHPFNLSEGQRKKVISAFKNDKDITLRITDFNKGNHFLPMNDTQMKKFNKNKKDGKPFMMNIDASTLKDKKGSGIADNVYKWIADKAEKVPETIKSVYKNNVKPTAKFVWKEAGDDLALVSGLAVGGVVGVETGPITGAIAGEFTRRNVKKAGDFLFGQGLHNKAMKIMKSKKPKKGGSSNIARGHNIGLRGVIYT
jgi:hypothetical protein